MIDLFVCLQFTVSPNGYAGLTYEHTPAEGPAVASLMDYVMDKLYVVACANKIHILYFKL